tara:strand:+ start:1142 stop:2023 length:882 start_codon:yes stop_codon:yes gene_type:complete
MTTTEIAQRLLRYTRHRDLSNVPADDALDLLEAVAGGLNDWFSLVPTDFKRKTRTATLKKSTTLAGCVFKQGSKDFTPSADLSDFIGCSCRVVLDGKYNRIVAPGKLLFEAESSGSLSLEYWKDAVHLGRALRLVNSPLVRGKKLRMWNDKDRDHRTYNNSIVLDGHFNDNIDTGEPRRFWVDIDDHDGEGSPRFMLRVWPLPDDNEQIVYDLESYAPRYGPSSLKTPEQLPVPDEYCEAIVLPLAARELMASPIFEGDKNAVEEKGKRAEMRAMKLVPVSANMNHIYTPGGW